MGFRGGEITSGARPQADAESDPHTRHRHAREGLKPMASYPELRRTGKRPASAGRIDVRGNLPRLATVVLVLAAAAFAVLQFASVGTREQAPSVPSFLTRSLGAADSSAPLIRRPSHDLRIELGVQGYTFRAGGTAVTAA